MNDLDTKVHLYVVAALPPDEAAEFETHLAECAGCRAEVAELREITAQLSRSVATEPPPALRGAVLAAIARIPQSPVTDHQQLTSDDGSTTNPPGRHREVAPEPTGATVVPLHRSRAGRLSALLAAAAVLAALALGGWALQARQDAERAADQATASTHRLAELLSASDVRVVSGKVATTRGTAAVVMSPSRNEAVFVSTALPELPEGKVYEAWTFDPRPVPAGIFSAGEAKTAVSLPPEAFDAKSVAVTVEPAGGSQTPTNKPIFVVRVPQS